MEIKRQWLSVVTMNIKWLSVTLNSKLQLILFPQDRIVVGHMIRNDFNVLQYKHKAALVRDTALYTPIRGLCGTDSTGRRPMSLKKLTKILLGEFFFR